eukprot:13366803-Alexandrium_andersonii.AAC.1
MLGLRAADGRLRKKPTRILSSMPEITQQLGGLRCDQSAGHTPHAPVIGGSRITAAAGHYPAALCR